MKKLVLVMLAMFAIATAHAKKHYITGAQKVTFRAGPGTGNKIISMLEADDAVTLLEDGEEWSKVKNSEGKEGYVMKRFLSTTVPYSIKYNWLLGQHKKLKDELSEIKENQATLNQTLGEAKRELASTKENLQQTNSSYEELKTGSAEYLELKGKFEETTAALNGSNKEVAILKEKLSLYYFTWFLAGAGVLLLGWMIGFFSKRKKRGYGGGISL